MSYAVLGSNQAGVSTLVNALLRTLDSFASCKLLIKDTFILIEKGLNAYGDGELRIEDHFHQTS